MTKKKLKSFWGFAMASVLMVSSLVIPAQAAAFGGIPSTSRVGVVPRWDYLAIISGDMEIEDSGWATITVSAHANFSTVNKIKVKCELQVLENARWKTLKSWSETEDAAVILYEKNYAVYKGHSYRLKITAYAYDGGTLLEQVTETFDYGFFN